MRPTAAAPRVPLAGDSGCADDPIDEAALAAVTLMSKALQRIMNTMTSLKKMMKICMRMSC
jgi:hypothetical protein